MPAAAGQYYMNKKNFSLELNLSEANQLFELLDNIVCEDYCIADHKSVKSDNKEFAKRLMDCLYNNL